MLKGTIGPLTVSSITISTAIIDYASISSANVTNLTYGTLTPAIGASKVVKSSACVSQSVFSTTSTSFVNTNLVCTITPSSASSKIVIFVGGTVAKETNTGSYGQVTLLRDSTNIGHATGGLYQFGSNAANDLYTSGATVFVDSPAQTSATVYRLQIKTTSGAQTVGFGANSVIQTMLLQEVTIP